MILKQAGAELCQAGTGAGLSLEIEFGLGLSLAICSKCTQNYTTVSKSTPSSPKIFKSLQKS